jgi:conjugal transfer pilus assembly protein TraV
MRTVVAAISVLVFGCCALLAGCRTVGEKSFSCPGRPVGVHCMSTTEVYAATENTDVVAPTSSRPLGDDPARARKVKKAPRDSHSPGSAQESRGASTPPATVPTVMTLAVDKPIPIRTPPQVMRAWVAPWEDLHQVLHGGGYQFVEIEHRRWSFGEPVSGTTPVRSFAIQKVNPTEAVGKEPSASSARTAASERVQQANSSPSPTSGAAPWSTSNHGGQPPP